MFTAILKALAALPAIIQLFRDFGAWAKEVQLDNWINELSETTARLKSAKSSEDRLKASLDLHNLIGRL